LKAELGNELTPTQVKDQPTVRWNAEPYSFYTLCLVGKYITELYLKKKMLIIFLLFLSDPDAGSKKEFQHWLVGNIQGSDVSRGETLTAYVGSATPPNTGNKYFIEYIIQLLQGLHITFQYFLGLHRYVFLVYMQPSKLVFNEPHISNK